MSTKQIPSPEKIAFGDFENELSNTRKVLERVPGDKLGWKPHEKSMSLGELAQHVANLPWFAQIAVTQDEYDIAGWQRPAPVGSTAELLALFEETAAAARAALAQVSADALLDPWTLRKGEEVFFTLPRVAVVRAMSISHMVHHPPSSRCISGS